MQQCGRLITDAASLPTIGLIEVTPEKYSSWRSQVLISLGALLMLLLVNFPVVAAPHASDDAKAQELKTINQQINTLQKGLTQAHNKQATLQHELRQRQAAIGQRSYQLQELDKKLAQQNAELLMLKNAESNNEQSVAQHQDALAQQIRAAYMQGQQPYLKLLLTQQDVAAVNRTLIYNQYLTRARIDSMTQLQQTITHMRDSQQQMEQQSKTLETLRSQQQRERLALISSQQQGQQVLGQVQADIQVRGQKLAQLLTSKKALEQVITKLGRLQKTFVQPNLLFEQLKGKLQWPTQGPVVHHFGTQLGEGELKYSGILIGAPEGQDVRAIYPGRIIFANWLQGFGLLLILDHGNGYMSLYGYNHSLYKKTGDTVVAGDLIGSIGDNGGRDQSGLYFEIRQAGHALNPEGWLANK